MNDVVFFRNCEREISVVFSAKKTNKNQAQKFF